MNYFCFFNTDSNKFNFINGDGTLYMKNNQPFVRTSSIDTHYIPACDRLCEYTLPVDPTKKYIMHVSFKALNTDLCAIDNLTLSDALEKAYVVVSAVHHSETELLYKYPLVDPCNPIVTFTFIKVLESCSAVNITVGDLVPLQINEFDTAIILQEIM